eukprot:8864986-Pyramimonas_sp.AAC.1
MPVPTTGGGAALVVVVQPRAQQPAGGRLVHGRALFDGRVEEPRPLGSMNLRETAESPLQVARA